jgi:hypothetical protein
MFVNGDSYATPGAYSTRTDIIDMGTGAVLFDLDQLAVTKDGKPYQEASFNFWGVTFADDERHFYATLGTGALGSGGAPDLIEGDLTTRRAWVVASNVACPSLSPDGREIAFKRQLPGSTVTWRLSVLDLATGKVHPLAETRNVDDQAEWLNDNTILYGLLQNRSIPALNMGLGTQLVANTWSVPADGSGEPHLFSTGAWSEVVTSR